MAQNKIDWSQFEVKGNESGNIDWSQFEVKDGKQDNDEAFPIPETTGLSGLGADLLSAAFRAKDFAQDIPNKLEKSGKYIEEHPGSSILHNAGQLAAGAADVGKSIVNAPHDLLKYFIKKHLAFDIPLGGKWHTSDLIPHIPEDTGIEKALGLEADPEKGDDLIRAIPEIAADVAGGVGLLKSGKKIFKAPDLKEAIRDTQKTVNAKLDKSGKVFDKIENTLDETGKNIVSIDKDLIEQAKSMLSKKFNNIVEKARGGDYKALRKLQAALGAKERKGLASDNLADVDLAENIGVVRNDINSAIQDHLEANGFDDLAKALKKNKSDYRDIKQTYFSTPQLAKVFGKSQKVPVKPKTLLSEESTEMKKFMTTHPEVEKALAKALKHENKMKVLGKIGAALGIGTAAEGAKRVISGKW